MSLTLQVIMGWLEELAPRAVAEEWDNVGLLVGSPRQQVQRVAVALDARESTIREATAMKADLLLTHHPVIFRPLNAVRTDLASGGRVASALAAGLAVYAMHTNLDIAPGGVNDALAEVLGVTGTKPLTLDPGVKKQKLVVFVPQGYAAAVRDAISAAGAGVIGEYTHCTFGSPGEGTFRPSGAANPFTGETRELNLEDEIRVEAVLPAFLGDKAVRAAKRVHPYEEMAYDLYPLEEKDPRWGLGRVGYLPKAPGGDYLTLREVASRVKERLGCQGLRVTGDLSRPVRKVALCGGKAGELLRQAAAKGADVYITGEAGYHEAQEAEDLGLALIEAGHYETEVVVLPRLVHWLEEKARENKAELETTIIAGSMPWEEI